VTTGAHCAEASSVPVTTSVPGRDLPGRGRVFCHEDLDGHDGVFMRRCILAFTASTIALAGCRQAPTAPVGDSFTLKSGASIAVEDHGPQIRFLRVAGDSRCPSDVDCIWAGNARVELEVRLDNAVDTLALNTFDGPKAGVAGRYRIELVSLAPVPRSGASIEPGDYRVTLKVTEPGPVCTMEAHPGISITLADSLAPSTQSFTNVIAVATDAAYRDTALVATFPPSPYVTTVSLAYERAGTYTVDVRADGYAPWTRTGIEVQRDECHVVTVPLYVRLAPNR
jgi:hypothetical protein